VVDLGGRRVDVGEEVERHGIVGLFALRVAGESQGGFLEVELDFGGRDVGGNDGDEDVVFGGVAAGGALCPGDCGTCALIIGCYGLS